MEVHHGGGNIGESRCVDVRPELHSWVETRASDRNRDLQGYIRIKNQTINMNKAGAQYMVYALTG